MTGFPSSNLQEKTMQDILDRNLFSVLPFSLCEEILTDLEPNEIAKSSIVSDLWHSVVKELKVPCQGKDCNTMINWRREAKGLKRDKCEPCYKKAMEVLGSQKCIDCRKKITDDNCVQSADGGWYGICSTCNSLNRHMNKSI